MRNEELISNFRAIYEDSPFIVTYKEPDLDIIYCNKLMRSYVGYNSLNEIVGKSDYDFRWAHFADLYSKHELDALKNNIYTALFPVCDFHGNNALVTCHRTPFFDKNEKPIGVLTHTFLLKDKRALELTNIIKNTAVDKQGIYSVNMLKDKNILTNREHECLFYYIRGKSCKMIGKILEISPRTVETHIDNIKLKFNCIHKSELIDRAIELGYLYDIPTSLLNKKFIVSLIA